MFSVGLDALNLNIFYYFIQFNDYLSWTSFASINALNILPIISSSASSEAEVETEGADQGNKTEEMSYSNEEIKQIIFGSLLGDAKLELPARGKNARFGFIQSKKFESYFLHLYSILKPYCIANYNTYTYTDKRTGNTYISLRFWTRALPLFTEFYYLFYINKVKSIPDNLSLLTPLALAHWIMQDGAKGSSGGLYICTDLYTPEETKRLANKIASLFQENLNITTPKAPGNRGALRIYIGVSSMNLLRSHLKTHIHPSMLYKLGI